MTPVDRFGDERDAGDDAGSRQREKRSSTTPRQPRPLQWETVPAGAQMRPCTGCKARLFWITRPSTAKKGKNVGKMVKVPVHCAVTGGKEPTQTSDGLGVNHFGDCPNASRF